MFYVVFLSFQRHPRSTHQNPVFHLQKVGALDQYIGRLGHMVHKEVSKIDRKLLWTPKMFFSPCLLTQINKKWGRFLGWLGNQPLNCRWFPSASHLKRHEKHSELHRSNADKQVRCRQPLVFLVGQVQVFVTWKKIRFWCIFWKKSCVFFPMSKICVFFVMKKVVFKLAAGWADVSAKSRVEASSSLYEAPFSSPTRPRPWKSLATWV